MATKKFDIEPKVWQKFGKVTELNQVKDIKQKTPRLLYPFLNFTAADGEVGVPCVSESVSDSDGYHKIIPLL